MWLWSIRSRSQWFINYKNRPRDARLIVENKVAPCFPDTVYTHVVAAIRVPIAAAAALDRIVRTQSVKTHRHPSIYTDMTRNARPRSVTFSRQHLPHWSSQQSLSAPQSVKLITSGSVESASRSNMRRSTVVRYISLDGCSDPIMDSGHVLRCD